MHRYTLKWRSVHPFIRGGLNSLILFLSQSQLLMAAGFPVPPAEKLMLQEYLDQYGHVILEPLGDYRNGGEQKLMLSSDQRIEGGFGTVVPTIEIPAGVSNVTVEGVVGADGSAATVVFTGEGATNTDSTNYDVTILGGSNGTTLNKTLRIQVNPGAQVERLRATYIGGVSADLTVSGYIRNSVFQAIAGRGNYVHVALAGNTVTPSYGNAILGFASTGPVSAANVSRFGDLFLIGADVESWSCARNGPYQKRAFVFDNMDAVRMVGPSGSANMSCANSGAMTGISNTSKVVTWFDRSLGGPMDADDAYYDNVAIHAETHKPNVVTQSFTNDPSDAVRVKILPAFEPQQPIGIPANTVGKKALIGAYLGAVKQSHPILPQFVTDDPLGDSWDADLANQPDSWNLIQDQLNTSHIVKLAPGKYYLSQPLQIGAANVTEGIIGTGKDEVFLISMGDHPVIQGRGNFSSGTGVRIVLEGLSVYGGTYGLDFSETTFGKGGQMSWSSFRKVIFSRQSVAGVNFHNVYGMDNNIWYDVSFVSMPIAYKGFGDTLGVGGVGSTYADKQYFIGNRYTNISDTVWNWDSRRGSGHNIWINAYYHTVGKVSRTRNAYNLLWINSVFHDVTGLAGAAIDVEDTGGTSNSNFFTQVGCVWEGTGPDVVTDTQAGLVGTLFIDTKFAQLNGSIVANTGNQTLFAWNSEIAGGASVGSVRYGAFINSKMGSFNRRLTYVYDWSSTHIANNAAQPYHQVLAR